MSYVKFMDVKKFPLLATAIIACQAVQNRGQTMPNAVLKWVWVREISICVPLSSLGFYSLNLTFSFQE
jgi:hypothetical protein